MSVAFMAGLYVVLHNMCNWLAIMLLVMGTIFLTAILGFLIPFYSPTSHINKYVRCIFNLLFQVDATGLLTITNKLEKSVQ